MTVQNAAQSLEVHRCASAAQVRHHLVAQGFVEVAKDAIHFFERINATIKNVAFNGREAEILHEQKAADVHLIALGNEADQAVTENLEIPAIHSLKLAVDARQTGWAVAGADWPHTLRDGFKISGGKTLGSDECVELPVEQRAAVARQQSHRFQNIADGTGAQMRNELCGLEQDMRAKAGLGHMSRQADFAFMDRPAPRADRLVAFPEFAESPAADGMESK